MIRLSLALAAATAAAACGPGELGPDAGGDDVDAGGGMGGLVFRFSAPEAGQPIGDTGVEITSLRLRLVDLRASGDAGPTADTYLAEAELELQEGAHPEIEFNRAPPGRYSAFEFDLERESDENAAWMIEGVVEIDGEAYGLEIDDEQSASISLPLDPLDLGADRTVEVEIAVDLAAIAVAIDWAAMPIEDGSVVVDDDSPTELGLLRAALLTSFSVESITTIE